MIRSLVLCVLCAVLAGCEIVSPAHELSCDDCGARLEVHLNNNFEGDHVIVHLNDDVLFDARATTNFVWSLAEIIRVERPAGAYRLSVKVNGSHEASRTINLDDRLYVLVRFYEEAIPALGIPQGLVIEPTTERPLYD